MIKKFKKKPIVIEAVQCAVPNIPTKIAVWCGGNVCGVHVGVNQWIEIETLEGTMKASYNDWIIKGVNGEFYPCKPDIFEATYDEVEE